MGPILPKPVSTKILERKSHSFCRVGLASMNGFRESQEDAHAILLRPKWGFFGVFDGHCGPLCSQFVSRRFQDLLRTAPTLPLPDQAIVEMCLKIDREFLDTQQEGGSTGTFVFVYDTGKGKFKVQVGNVGDSRVVLGIQRRRPLLGSCVSLTDDHKPGNPSERKRIEKAGGSVANGRVDGALAVSRAFGDRQYKTGGRGERDHKVIAVPDIKTAECDRGDVLLLCCDGIFESDAFSNKSVISFMWDRLEHSGEKDLAVAAAACADAAVARGSKDNVSVMLVQLGDGPPVGAEHEFLPGPYAGPAAAVTNAKFRNAYKAACAAAKVTLPQCLDVRCAFAEQELQQRKQRTECTDRTCDHARLSSDDLRSLLQRLALPVTHSSGRQDMLGKLRKLCKHGSTQDTRPCDVQDLEEELRLFGLPPHLRTLPPGRKERLEFFASWAERHEQSRAEEHFPGKKIMDLQHSGVPMHIIMRLAQQQSFSLPGTVGQ